MGRPRTPMTSTLWAACRAACADEFLERMPDGLDTDLGQGGVNVSGGPEAAAVHRPGPAEAAQGADL